MRNKKGGEKKELFNGQFCSIFQKKTTHIFHFFAPCVSAGRVTTMDAHARYVRTFSGHADGRGAEPGDVGPRRQRDHGQVVVRGEVLVLRVQAHRRHLLGRVGQADADAARGAADARGADAGPTPAGRVAQQVDAEEGHEARGHVFPVLKIIIIIKCTRN